MAKEARKLQRAQARATDSVAPSDRPGLPKPGAGMPDTRAQIRALVGRLAIPVLAGWVLCGSIAAFVHSKTWKAVLIGIPAVVTVIAVGLIIFALRQAKKAQGVANILGKVETEEDRKAAFAQLEAGSN